MSLIARLQHVTAVLEKTALDPAGQRAKSIPRADAMIENIRKYLETLPDEIMGPRQWKWVNEIQNRYKINFIPMLAEYLARSGLNPKDNAVPVFRDLDKLRLVLENEDIAFEKLAPDRDRIRKAREIQEFLRRLSAAPNAPLRDVVEKLNNLDFRNEASTVQRFIKDSQAISDVLERVIIQG